MRKVVICVIGYALVAALGVGIGWFVAIQQNNKPHHDASAGQNTFLDLARGIFGGGEIKLTGKVSGLFVGKRAPLRVQLKNTTSRSVALRTLVVTAHDASRRCRARDNLIVENYDSRRHGAKQYVFRGHSTGYVTLGVILIADPTRNQDACKNVVFALDYTATASTD